VTSNARDIDEEEGGSLFRRSGWKKTPGPRGPQQSVVVEAIGIDREAVSSPLKINTQGPLVPKKI
jgi:hypothetical protein